MVIYPIEKPVREQLSYHSVLVESIRVFSRVSQSDYRRRGTMVIVVVRARAFHQCGLGSIPASMPYMD